MSLRDALLKSGAVSKKKVKQVERDLKNQRKKAQGHQERKNAVAKREKAEARRLAAERRAERAAAVAERRDRSAEEARVLQRRHLLEAHRIQVRTGQGTRFFFAHDGVVKRLLVPWTIARGLRAGVYAIAVFERPYAEDEYVVVPSDVADRVGDAVIFRNLEPGDEGFTDDY